MIDIQKLKQFPLGFKQFEGYIEKQYGSVLFLYNGSGTIKNEDVVLFGDENGLHVTVGAFEDFKQKLNFNYYVLYNVVDGSRYNTRNEATEAAIIKIFELLETKLKTN